MNHSCHYKTNPACQSGTQLRPHTQSLYALNTCRPLTIATGPGDTAVGQQDQTPELKLKAQDNVEHRKIKHWGQMALRSTERKQWSWGEVGRAA